MAAARKAVVLLSGGLDSTTVLAIAQQQGYEAYALSFDYGQHHRIELEAATRIAEKAAVNHVVAKIDLRVFGGLRPHRQHRRPQAPLPRRHEHRRPHHLRPRPQHHLPLLRPRLGRGPRRQRHLHRRQRPRLQRLPRLPPRVHRRLRTHGKPRHQSRHRRRRPLQDPHPAH